MWVAVLESAQLRSGPVRALYWGTPIVVFRTSSGRLGALEDLCGHRGIPLSQGTVLGNSIRCGFHHFRFDTNGDCVSVPEVFGADETFRRRCRVRRFFVREEVGLIWVSVEDEPDAEFPVQIDSLPKDRITAAGSFAVDGDLRVWLDHFLDVPHCIWTHAESTYSGSPERPAELASLSIGIEPDSRYPVRSAIDMTFRVEDDGGYARYSLPMRTLVALDRTMARLRRRSRSGRVAHVSVRADLVTPLCQETVSRVGSMEVRAWTSISPLSTGKNRFFYAAVADGCRRGPGGKVLARRLLNDFVRQHLGVEDAHWLAAAQYLAGERFRATELDSTVLAMREIFAAYRSEKCHLYPAGSLIHSIEYGGHSV